MTVSIDIDLSKYQIGDQVPEKQSEVADVIPGKKRRATRKERRRFIKGEIQMEKFRRQVYRLSPKLKAISFGEVKVGDALFQAEARRLYKTGLIKKIPPGGFR